MTLAVERDVKQQIKPTPLTVSKIYPRPGIIGQVHYGKYKGQIKVTP